MGVSALAWKPVDGYEGMYEVSNKGDVRSRKTGHYRLLKPKFNRTTGYMYIILSNGIKPKTFPVHRLVAEAFIPNPNSLPFVNHKDEDKTNNVAENLEWCTPGYNTEYSKHKRFKRVSVFLPEGQKVATFESVTFAANFLGVGKGALVNALKEKTSSCAGFVVKYEGGGGQ